jgi:hypothetical protein
MMSMCWMVWIPGMASDASLRGPFSTRTSKSMMQLSPGGTRVIAPGASSTWPVSGPGGETWKSPGQAPEPETGPSIENTPGSALSRQNRPAVAQEGISCTLIRGWIMGDWLVTVILAAPVSPTAIESGNSTAGVKASAAGAGATRIARTAHSTATRTDLSRPRPRSRPGRADRPLP